jgi:hypothetical protein
MTNDHTSFDVAASKALAERVDAAPKECYRNALMAVLTEDELADAYYVEGVALYEDTGLPVAHGWVERADGVILDPTAALLTQGTVRYFVGDRYTARESRRFVGKLLPIGFAMTAGMANAWRATYASMGFDIPGPDIGE